MGEGDGLGEGKVFVEVFDGVGVVGSDVDISLKGMCARGEREEECEGYSCNAHDELATVGGL